MTTSLDGQVERFSAPVAVITSDGATWTWDEMFHEFAPAICSYARSRDASNVDDIVKGLFRSVAEKSPTIPGDRLEMRFLVFTIVHRRIADAHPSFDRRPETLAVACPQMTGQDPGVEEAITIGETSSGLLTRLNPWPSITSPTRMEAAAALDVSKNSVTRRRFVRSKGAGRGRDQPENAARNARALARFQRLLRTPTRPRPTLIGNSCSVTRANRWELT